MKPDNINCSLVNYFTVLYISYEYKKISQVIEKLEVENGCWCQIIQFPGPSYASLPIDVNIDTKYKQKYIAYAINLCQN